MSDVPLRENTIWMSGCNSWYLDATGVPASWTFSYDRFVDEMNAPDLSAFVLSRLGAPSPALRHQRTTDEIPVVLGNTFASGRPR